MTFSEKTTLRLHALADAHPFTYTEIIGTSRLGTPLYALVIGYGAQTLGYNAAHHANEWITTLLLLQFVEEYCTCCAQDKNTLLERFTLCAIPLVNPDGADAVIAGTKPADWKANACGVDLNSNYPASWEIARAIKATQGYTVPGPRGFPGHAPLCEPESAAMSAYTQLRDFSLTISLHTQGAEIYHQYRHFAPPGANQIADKMARVSGYECVHAPEDASHGGYRDWFIERFNRPGFTMECGRGENPLPMSDYKTIYNEIAPALWVPMKIM